MFIFKQFNIIFISCFVLLLLLMYIYRIPKRKKPNYGDEIITSPCDGRVVSIQETKERMYKISIELSILDVVIQWYPVEGIIRNVIYKSSKYKYPNFLNNTERYTTILQHNRGIVRVDQIGNRICRCVANKSISNTFVRRGNIMGLMGTTVEIHIPIKKTDLFIQENDIIVGKTSAIAKWI